MKTLLIYLLPIVQGSSYTNLHDVELISCQSQLKIHPSKLDLSLNGNQGKQNKLAFLLLSCLSQCLSYIALTRIPRSLPIFSLLLNHYWQSSKNISPIPFAPVGGFQPLIHLKAIGVIWMISQLSMPVKRSGELLHIFGGV